MWFVLSLAFAGSRQTIELEAPASLGELAWQSCQVAQANGHPKAGLNPLRDQANQLNALLTDLSRVQLPGLSLAVETEFAPYLNADEQRNVLRTLQAFNNQISDAQQGLNRDLTRSNKRRSSLRSCAKSWRQIYVSMLSIKALLEQQEPAINQLLQRLEQGYSRRLSQTQRPTLDSR